MTTPGGRIKVMALAPTMRTGGAERVLSLLLQQLDRDRFAPEITIAYDRDIAYPIPGDVPVHILEREPVPACERVDLALPSDLAEEFEGSAMWLRSVAETLAEVVWRETPDVIISSPLWASILAIVGHDAMPPGTKLVNRVDAPPSVSLAQSALEPLFRHIMREGFNKADRVIAVSRAVGRDLVENFNVDEARIQVVNNPVDIERIGRMAQEPVEESVFDDGAPTVLFVGRLERVKGLEYLIRAAASVLEKKPMRLVLVGDGSHAGYLRALTKHLGVEEHVHFLGRRSNPFKYMARATVFVLPSLSEGMPNVLLEAMACGCPVIASDIAGGISREVLDEGKYGLIVPREDADALADALRTMLQDDDRRRTFAARGIARAAEFDLPGIMQINQDLLLEVAAERAEVPGEDEDDSRQTAQAIAGQPTTAAECAPPSTQARSSRLQIAVSVVRERGWRALASAMAARLLGRKGGGARGSRTAEILAGPRLARKAPGKTRLAVLVPSMDDAYMGAGTEVLLRSFDRDAYEVLLVRVHGGADGGAVPADVPQFVLGSRHGEGLLPTDGMPADIAERNSEGIEWFSASARALCDLAEELDLDAVLAQGFYASMIATVARPCLPDTTAVVASMHSTYGDFMGAVYGGDLYKALIRGHFRDADTVVAPNAGIAKELVDRFEVSPDAVAVIPDPIDTDAARAHAGDEPAEHPWLSESGYVFAYPLEAGWEEAMPYVLEGVALARRHEPVRCLVLGTTESAAVAEAATRAGVAEAVAFVDAQGRPWRYLHRVAALIHAAASPGTNVPSTVVDALASGCAVISTRDSEAVGEMLGEAGGVLVPMKDAPAVADAMLQIVWDYEERDRMARSGPEHLGSVSSGALVPRFEQLISDLVARRRQLPSQ